MAFSKRYLYLGFAVISTALLACEKVINLDLREAEQRYVIEGFITNGDTSRVMLSRTKNFSDSNTFVGVSGAQIQVREQTGRVISYTERRAGVYEAVPARGVPGQNYQLIVQVEGKRFEATSTMPLQINLDSLYITPRIGFDGRTRKVVTAQFNDPPGKGNAYKFIKYVNGAVDTRIFVRDDALTDGRTVKAELRGGLEIQDTVRLQMLCIDYPIYKFWLTLDQNARGNDNSPAPANPVSNIQGGALGYFSAHTVQEKEIIVR